LLAFLDLFWRQLGRLAEEALEELLLESLDESLLLEEEDSEELELEESLDSSEDSEGSDSSSNLWCRCLEWRFGETFRGFLATALGFPCASFFSFFRWALQA
jgi:hypothetical protein